MAELTPGDLAPNFELPRDGGGTVSLKGFAGHPVVLYFYPKDNTTGCTAEAIDFTALAPEFEKKGAVVIGMSADPVKSHDKFITKYGLTVILASDEEAKVMTEYGVWKEKSMYGRSFMGVVRTTFLIGPDGRIIRIWDKVKVKGHAQEVLDAVGALAGA
ncbi:peroxiredoxin [Ciceribacter thiooxidans]|uniref:thioredoxin-dependent peroxiredoxin n=1 Tax=Ciceribacter thiooxidans TaxID=1969821 RepID=A0ABV7I4C1_9HYPH|nr:peroxiredoxin [Ciceribacter thiooxidans]